VFDFRRNKSLQKVTQCFGKQSMKWLSNLVGKTRQRFSGCDQKRNERSCEELAASRCLPAGPPDAKATQIKTA
jgi:hypothetical protein